MHLGSLSFKHLLGYLAIEGKLLQLLEGEVTQMVVPLHQFSLVISCSKGDVFIRSDWWRWIKSEGPMANRLIRGGRLIRWVGYIRRVKRLVVFVDLAVNLLFPIASKEILFSHKFLRCDLGILPQKRAFRNLKDCLPLEEWGLTGFKCSSECPISAQRRSRQEGWKIWRGAEGSSLLASITKQNAAIIEIPHLCLLFSCSLCPMLW